MSVEQREGREKNERATQIHRVGQRRRSVQAIQLQSAFASQNRGQDLAGSCLQISDDGVAFFGLKIGAWGHPANEMWPALARVFVYVRQGVTFQTARSEKLPSTIQLLRRCRAEPCGVCSRRRGEAAAGAGGKKQSHRQNEVLHNSRPKMRRT